MENIETLLAAVAQTQGFDDDEPVVSTGPELGLENSGSSGAIREDDSGSQLSGGVYGDARPFAVVDAPPPAPTPTFPTAGQMIGAGDKRKRGRPPKGQLGARPPPPKRPKPEDEEEDVCFICFDGGSLVLCDRKACPKAYHPACIKRDEAFFQSKAKWNCGWHICSVCRKSSHYMCYTCTYSLCKGCTKDADYVNVRGNKGFCSTCMKTIMLIENKDQVNNESVQVDFDDKLSWEYLFKVYWVILKEKLSLTLTELTQAKNPWKGVATVVSRPQLSNVLHTAVDGKVSTSYRSSEQLELNQPQVDISVVRNNEPKAKPNCEKDENGLNLNIETAKQNIDKATDEPSTYKTSNETTIKEADDRPQIGNDQSNSSIVKDTEKPCICKNTTKSDKPEANSCTEWATKDLLEFVAHMKNGDISAISQFDVQQLLLEYIKRNNLRDPRRKSQIICDPRLKNLFGKPRVGHIEMLKLLEFHFLIKESNNSFIPAGLVSSFASDMEVDGSTYQLPVQSNSRKRKTGRKSVDRAAQNNLPQNNLNEYAAIDVHNINLIYLRQNLMENLIEDKENFSNKVIGSIVRIRLSSADQKPDVHRLVQVVGTSKVAEPYKIGEKTVDIMLEVLNLDKKEVVSIDTISNQDFTEDECRRLRQSIRCGLVKQFTVGEVQKKAMTLQPLRVNDWLEAEILRLNHLRDRASENGRKKELREHVAKLQLLKSPEERQRRISEVPEIHSDPKMSPDYESEDAGSFGNTRKDKDVKSSFPNLPENERNSISLNKKVKEERSTKAQTRMTGKADASGSRSSATVGGRNDQTVASSPSTNHIETEKLWHYRDPNGKIQGAFSMMQLRKWSTTGLFPVDMRIWTNHEQYDSVLLTDALNGKFHGPSELSNNKPMQENGTNGKFHGPSELSNNKPKQENGTTKENRISEGKNGKGSKQTETPVALSNNTSVLSESNIGIVKADESGSCSWPQCWDLLKDNNNNNNNINSSADDVQERNLLPSSSLGQTDELKNASQNGEKKSAEPTEFQNQPNSQEYRATAEEVLRSLNIDLSSDEIESVPVSEPVLKSPDVSNIPSLTPKTAEDNRPLSAGVPMENSIILELLPRSNHEDGQAEATETKQQHQSEFVNFNMPNNSGPTWNMPGVQIPQVADEWCGYSPTPSKQEWDPSSSKPITHTSSPPHPTSNISNWLSIINASNSNEPIEFDALGEESVSDLLAEVDAMESQGALPSPTSAMKFARELIEDCRDDCFSSIEEFRSSTSDPRKSDALSSTEIQLNSESSAPCNKPFDAFDSFKRSSVHSSASSEGETNAPVYSSEFHPPENVGPPVGSDSADPSWGTVQGNINLVTVQGNVNLVLGGPGQGMANLGWGNNPGTGGWVNPNINRSPINGSLPWDGGQRKYGGERFTSPREWGGYQGRPPWGRQPYGGGGYNRPKGQRVCKFYESGHCKKGAFCDYLHP